MLDGGAMVMTSCGVLVRDAAGLVLLGQATGSARWDIPKGVAEAGESFVDAAVRELREETGLHTDPAMLRALGVHRYLPAKQLALFGWEAGAIEVAGLRCSSTFRGRDGREVPELARFALLAWDEALGRVGKNMRRVLEEVGPL
ncbi:MAG: NUDIX domain-containing protein [Janthinobacterium lividum]